MPCYKSLTRQPTDQIIQDEVFHVGQVQQYCRGNYWHWDPKITTPPGLYVLSFIFYKITGRCDLDALRFINALSLFAVFFFLLHTAPPVSPRSAKQLPSEKSTLFLPLASLCPQQIHSALNICLFPPLFFFCALYYTDVASTLSVLLFTRHLLENNSRGPSTFFQACLSILLAIISLSFRQTNIFWVGVFPIALLALGALHKDVESIRPGSGKSVVLHAWANATFYDPQMRDAMLNGQSPRLPSRQCLNLTRHRFLAYLHFYCDIGPACSVLSSYIA